MSVFLSTWQGIHHAYEEIAGRQATLLKSYRKCLQKASYSAVEEVMKRLEMPGELSLIRRIVRGMAPVGAWYQAA